MLWTLPAEYWTCVGDLTLRWHGYLEPRVRSSRTTSAAGEIVFLELAIVGVNEQWLVVTAGEAAWRLLGLCFPQVDFSTDIVGLPSSLLPPPPNF